MGQKFLLWQATEGRVVSVVFVVFKKTSCLPKTNHPSGRGCLLKPRKQRYAERMGMKKTTETTQTTAPHLARRGAKVLALASDRRSSCLRCLCCIPKTSCLPKTNHPNGRGCLLKTKKATLCRANGD